jgi:hypothetical protein
LAPLVGLADDADEVEPFDAGDDAVEEVSADDADAVAPGAVVDERLGDLGEAGTGASRGTAGTAGTAASPGTAAPAGTAAWPDTAGSGDTTRGASTENSGCGLACGAAAFVLECFLPFAGAGGGGLATVSGDTSVAEGIGADSF